MSLISLGEARSLVLSVCSPLPPVTVPVDQSLGCTLAADGVARVAVPPFPNSAMDGYALRSADVARVPATLRVVGIVLAGSGDPGRMASGEAIRIMTGAPVPSGADAVCMVEKTRTDGDMVVIDSSVSLGENIRVAGEDIACGAVVVAAGTTIGATQLAALVSAGCSEVYVVPRPRVGVISTGDELVDPGQSLGIGQIYDSNRPMLRAMVAEAGCVPVDLGHARDDEETITSIVETARDQIDALVLSGGVSVGDVDLVRVVLEKLGGGTGRSLSIAIRPAKPFAFAMLGREGAGLVGTSTNVPAFGLPGNPVSAAVSFELLVRPALLTMAGLHRVDRPVVTARAAVPLKRRDDGKVFFLRVALSRDVDGWVAVPVAGQGSHQIGSMARADGLAILDEGPGIAEGEQVRVMITSPDRLAEERVRW